MQCWFGCGIVTMSIVANSSVQLDEATIPQGGLTERQERYDSQTPAIIERNSSSCLRSERDLN